MRHNAEEEGICFDLSDGCRPAYGVGRERVESSIYGGWIRLVEWEEGGSKRALFSIVVKVAE